MLRNIIGGSNTAPATPQNLTATAGNAQVLLKWNKNTETDFLKYRIYLGSDSTTLSLKDSSTASILDTTKTIIGLTNGIKYFFCVSAMDSARLESLQSIVASATPINTTPTITSFSPTSGPIGTTVTITGSNFSTTAANNVVYFGAVKAVVVMASTTSLSVTVPIGATYQPITVTANGLTAYSAKPFIVTFAGGGFITSTSFASKVDFGGTSPSGIAIGDIDGDGKPDLVVSSGGSGTVAVFRNTGSSGSITSGSFAAKVDFTTGLNPFSVVIGDIDGDGKQDLVVTNSNSNSVSVFRNSSTSGSVISSSFAAKVDFTTGTLPHGVAIGDIDGDGKPDLVVVNSGSNTVSVFRNMSSYGSITSGSFATKVDFTTGAGAYCVAIGDIDGDGKPDLVVTNNVSSGTVSVFRNTSSSGSISFAARVDFATGAGPYNVAIGDIDGDGKPDLAVANYGGGTVSVLRNTSSTGSITSSSFAANVDFATGTFPIGVAIGDIDGDGKPDMAITNNTGNTVSVLRNTSSFGSITPGSFAEKVDFTTGLNPSGVVIGDVDGDGKPDLVVSSGGSGTVSVLRNTISGLNALIGIWDKVSGPGDPIRYIFLSDSIVVVVHNQTWSDTTNYTTFAIPSSILRGIDLSQNGVVGWRGVYQLSSDSSVFQIEGYWYTGLPTISTPTAFSTPTSYAKVVPGTLFTVSGTVKYASSTANPIGVVTVTLTPTTGTALTAVSNASGAYTIPNVSAGTYTLTAAKMGNWGGVTGGDALVVARHAAGIALLTGLPLTAADVNISGSVTGADALLIVRRAVGLDDHFAAGDWVFQSQTVTVGSAAVTADISGLAIGDVNASYTPSTGTVFAKSNVSVSLNSDAVQDVASVGIFDVPVRVTSDMVLGAVSLKINFPADVATFAGITSKLKGFVSRAGEGSMTIVWADLSATNAVQFKANEALVTLKFSPKAQKGTIGISIDSWSELNDADGAVISMAKLSAPITEIKNIPTVFSLDQNYPNPFNPSTTLRYGLPGQSSVRLVIYNVLGQIVKELINGEQQAGYQSVVWNANVSSGIYFYHLEAAAVDDPSKRFVETKKMLLLK
jgi:hypothetical protein